MATPIGLIVGLTSSIYVTLFAVLALEALHFLFHSNLIPQLVTEELGVIKVLVIRQLVYFEMVHSRQRLLKTIFDLQMHTSMQSAEVIYLMEEFLQGFYG